MFQMGQRLQADVNAILTLLQRTSQQNGQSVSTFLYPKKDIDKSISAFGLGP